VRITERQQIDKSKRFAKVKMQRYSRLGSPG
jgi:hypothetical protein